jgi:rhamnose transport system permease protein
MNALRALHPQTLRILALAAVLLLTFLFFATQIENYFSPRMMNRIATSAAVILPIAIGQALVVMTRNIDLSVGSVVGFTAYLVGDVLMNYPGLHPVAVVLLAVLCGALFGVVNGVLVAYGNVPSIIVTLGTLALYRTVLVEYSDARTITTGNLPSWVGDLPQLSLFTIGNFDMRVTVAIALAAALVFAVALWRLRAARKLYAVGSNPDAAAMAGIEAARSPASPVSSSSPSSETSPWWRASASSSSRSPPSWWAASISSAARAPSWAWCSAPCSSTPSTTASPAGRSSASSGATLCLAA